MPITVNTEYPPVFPGFPIAFFSEPCPNKSEKCNNIPKDFEKGGNDTDDRKLRREYKAFIKKTGRTDYDKMRMECDHAQELISASIKECESSNASKDALFTRLLAVVALCISIVSMIWSDCFQMTSYDWLRDILGENFPQNLPLKDSQLIAIDVFVTSVIIIVIFCVALLNRNDYSRNTRRRFCRAYQCFEVFKLALLDVQMKSDLE